MTTFCIAFYESYLSTVIAIIMRAYKDSVMNCRWTRYPWTFLVGSSIPWILRSEDKSSLTIVTRPCFKTDSVADADPGFWDGKKSDPRSGIDILDPRHWKQVHGIGNPRHWSGIFSSTWMKHGHSSLTVLGEIWTSVSLKLPSFRTKGFVSRVFDKKKLLWGSLWYQLWLLYSSLASPLRSMFIIEGFAKLADHMKHGKFVVNLPFWQPSV
jgi:hypothetical protein